MKLNRRSVLGAIGLVGVGTGAAFGSGAFTSTTANRAVEVNVFGAGSGTAGVIPGDGDTDDNAVGDAEQRNIADSITESAVDVLVDVSSESVAVRDDDDNLYRNGNELFPAAANDSNSIYSSVDGSKYISLVANDVTIVFGPDDDSGDAGGVPPNSTLTYADLFTFADPSPNSSDVTFETSSPSSSALLTDIVNSGDPSSSGGATVESVTDGGTVDGRITTGTASQDTETLKITIE